MRVPLSWLHDYCRPDMGVDELADRLDMTGTKVERLLRHGVGGQESFVVGRVLDVQRHPDAERLTVCRVAVGGRDVAQIVCGAPNVAAGQAVAVAHPGALMPDGTTLGAATLRGVESQGMILAEDELGIGPDHDGIIELEGELAPGTPLAEVLPIATDVLELEVTPNRPDCLGVYGVAREVHAATETTLEPPPWLDDPGSEGSVQGVRVEVEDAELCPRFTARLFEGVAIGPSPPWLKARLMAAGQRPISNVVDITNYVMLLTGQPMHAFDFDRVAGGHLIVRPGIAGDELETLDGEHRALDPDIVAIYDDEGPTSLAGVMGGASSEVSPGTTRVLMEAATWNGPNIHRTSLRLGLRSEASARFEKQLQPESALEAQAVAARLMVECCGARLAPGTNDVGGPGPPPARIRLREAHIARLLGEEIPRGRCERALTSLGFAVEGAGDALDVTVPPHRRGDVYREADLIEEVARIDGMERLPATLPARTATGGLTATQAARRRIEDALVGRGLLEAVGWSFHGPDVPDRLRLPADDPCRLVVELDNPMSEEQSVMRTTLLGSLLDVAHHNATRGEPDIRIFETGAVYMDDGERELPDERRHLGVLIAGAFEAPSWRSRERRRSDAFAAKAVAASLFEALRVPWQLVTARDGAAGFLHPGRAGSVLVDGAEIGWLGELHPLVVRGWDLEQLGAVPASAFELDLDALASAAAAAVPVYEDLISFPAVRQDIAVVVGEDVPAAAVIDVVRAAGGVTLERADVFDVYRGDQVGDGRVSLALALEFRARDRTLTDAEVAEQRERIAAALSEQLGGELRA